MQCSGLSCRGKAELPRLLPAGLGRASQRQDVPSVDIRNSSLPMQLPSCQGMRSRAQGIYSPLCMLRCSLGGAKQQHGERDKASLLQLRSLEASAAAPDLQVHLRSSSGETPDIRSTWLHCCPWRGGPGTASHLPQAAPYPGELTFARHRRVGMCWAFAGSS